TSRIANCIKVSIAKEEGSMITIERTGGGLCGETHVKHDGKTLVFHRDADVSATDHGVCIVERGLATSRTTYLLDGPRHSSGVLVDKADALRVHLQHVSSISIEEYVPSFDESYTVSKHRGSVHVSLNASNATKVLKYYPIDDVKAVAAEQNLLPAPPPPAPLPAAAPAPLITQVFVALWPFKSAATP
ncbi:MAG: hypothetical protein ABL897_10590, partial [Hyphomicrobium sp.]